MESALYFLHYALTLLFGIVVSFAFCGLRFHKKNLIFIGSLFVGCGMLQICVFQLLGEEMTWKLYPAIAHLPLALVLSFAYRKKIITVLASISLAYLCCQPSKYIGLLAELLTDNAIIVWCIQILIVLLVGFTAVRYFASYISSIFSKDDRSVWIFSGIPLVYYIFDYVVSVYTDIWIRHYYVAAEFLSFFLCISFMAFCVVYYKEYEQKADAERKEQIIQITSQQQAKEIAAIQKSALETSLLRHDMRLLLSSLALSIEQDDKENALKMISGFATQIEAAALHRYCKNDTVNYILANFENKCREQETKFLVTVEVDEITVDEVSFASILSNALDNALNAQAELPPEKREIRLMLKENNGKLLLSVKNPFKEAPVFIDDLPVSNKKGHGYGTQSIRYMTERLNGKCRFSLQDNTFVLRVVLR